jgi:hypothetical protein
MIEVEITDNMKKRAWKRAREMGELNNSITKGDGNIAGFLGEEVANEVLHGIINNTYDYDIITKTQTWDVKTKRCTSPPKGFYECSIAEYNTKQKCDCYVFVRIENIKGRWGRAWVLGWMDKQEYLKKAVRLKKGDIDESNGFVVKANCYNMKIKDLNSFEVAQ